jgi:hypothetical protein
MTITKEEAHLDETKRLQDDRGARRSGCLDRECKGSISVGKPSLQKPLPRRAVGKADLIPVFSIPTPPRCRPRWRLHMRHLRHANWWRR